MTEATLRRRLQALKAMTVSRGCTPAEAAIAARKAREIEARLPQPQVDVFAIVADIDRQIREARARREAAANSFMHEMGRYYRRSL